MKILIEAYSSNGDAVSCNLALVEFKPAHVLERAKLAKQVRLQDGQFFEMTFWDYSASFYDGYIDESDLGLSDEDLEKFRRDQFIVVPDDFGMCEDFMRTECDTLAVGDDSFYWQSNVKHCDVRVETYSIPFSRIA